VLFCSGKVYYDLLDGRASHATDEIAIVRMEQLYPFRRDTLQKILARYRKAREWAWVQEESQNMGAWTFMEPRLRALGCNVEYVGRDASGSPATGSLKVHQREQRELVEAAVGMPLPHLVRAGGEYQVKVNGAESDGRPPIFAPSGANAH
jgi:2-oxoglutarate dehydrogenase E1 component